MSERQRSSANVVLNLVDENDAMKQPTDNGEDKAEGLLRHFNEYINDNKKQNQEMKEEIEDLKCEIGEYITSESSLQSRLEQSEAQRKLVEKELRTREATCTNLEGQLDSKSKAVKKLKAEAKKLRDKHAEEMANLKAEMQSEINDDKKRYEAEISELKSKVSGVEGAYAEYSKKMDEILRKQ